MFLGRSIRNIYQRKFTVNMDDIGIFNENMISYKLKVMISAVFAVLKYFGTGLVGFR